MSATPPSLRSARPVPPGLVLAFVAGSLGLASWLVPDKSQLVGRLIEDGESERALQLAGHEHAPPAPPVPPPSPLERLRTVLREGEDQPAAADAIAAVNDPLQCFSLLNELEPRVRPEKRPALYLAISRSALAQNRPDLAADILSAALKRTAGSEALLREAVTACRWSGQPQRALSLVLTWKKTHGGHLDAADEDLLITLYRELNRPHLALDILTARLAKEKTAGGMRSATLHTALEVAGQANRVREMLPLIAEHLQGTPGGAASWQELPQNPAAVDEEFVQLAAMIARHAEWSGEPGIAVDWYLKLAVLGDREALERIESLHRGLNRQGDWLHLLERLVPLKERPELTRDLAKLQAGAGLYEEAERTYALWLRDHPDDARALTELGAMYEESGRLELALATWQRALKLQPNQLPLRKDIASLQIALKDFRSAFTFYHQLPESQHDAVSLENYALLAEAVADYKAHNRALLMRYHLLPRPRPVDFLELIRSFQVLDNTEGVITTLLEGMKRLPHSRVLRIELAQAYRKQGRLDEAVQLLARPELKSDMRAMCLFIECSALREDFQGALSFLGRGFERRFAFPPDVRLDLGHIYYNTGYLRDADRMYSSVPDEPGMWPLLADARFRRSDFAGAEEFQRRYLRNSRVADPQGWLFMGDILKAQGRTAEADAAYQKSLALMQNKIGPPPKGKPHARQARLKTSRTTTETH